ncbi:hypothetical protein COV19_04750 [Candidatus Woesearchaeota archaeon CG10_big_fil_rev_8_21_14_0_10_44_13]|nr:MAG: hypothetical protein COV19_04750 [Candidatus Woesearchaeota archaeon CG10_big_fil_rev_8_21_14_0_10_44_13]
MAQERVSMPSSMGGLVRYFDEYKSKIEFKPGHIVVFIVIIIILEIFLNWKGASLLGLA